MKIIFLTLIVIIPLTAFVYKRLIKEKNTNNKQAKNNGKNKFSSSNYLNNGMLGVKINHTNLNSNKYVIHPQFGAGEIKEKTGDIIRIFFKNYGEKQIVASFKGLRFISEEEFLDYDKVNNKTKNHESLYEESNDYYEKGTIINYRLHGFAEIVDVLEEYLIIRCIDGKEIKIRKSPVYKLEAKDIYSKNNFEKNLRFDDIVYNRKYGFGKVIYRNDFNTFVYWKELNDVAEIKNKNYYYLQKIDKDVFFKKYNININDILKLKIKHDNTILALVKNINLNSLRYINLNNNEIASLDIDKVKEPYDSDKEYNIKVLESPYLTYNQYKNILKNNNIYKKISINKKIFKKVNNVNNIYLNTRYKSLEDYLVYVMYTNDLYRYDYNLESQHYDYLLEKLCKNRLAIKTNNTYITVKKLAELGVYHDAYNEIKNKIELYLSEHGFITISKIKRFVNPSVLGVFPDDNSLMNLINSFDEFRKYMIGGKETLVIKTNRLRDEYFEDTIISFMRNEDIVSIDIYDFINILNRAYDFDFDFDVFVAETRKFQVVYFSEEMEKIYINKNEYYGEVFNNE